MSNVSEKHLRFEVARADGGNSTECFSFSPRVGHLHAGCAKTITVTFVPFKPTAHGSDEANPPLEIGVSLAPIVGYFEPPPPAAEGEGARRANRPREPRRLGRRAKTTRRTVVVEPERPGDGDENADGVQAEASVASVASVASKASAASVKTTVVFDPCPSRRSRRTRRGTKSSALRRFRRGG